ncbi:larval cuticle protein 2-like [Musca autumnalis]|uniref:larval cuticle protein 2-like n=1 Tax=Musca autumnalis TaxID=221902 RepID=UPI003CFB74AD
MFKFVVLCALIATAAAVSKHGNTKYHATPSVTNIRHFNAPGVKFSDDANAVVTRFASDVNENGFQYAFDTTNSIHASASGNVNGDHQGEFGWISPEGENVVVEYVADENGYQPRGALLPTPPPIPVAILKSLEYIRTHPHPEQETANTFVRHSVKSVTHKAAKHTGRRF